MSGFFDSDLKRMTMVLTIAFFLRIAAIVVWNDSLSQDTDAYRGIAEKIAAGEGFSNPETGRPTAFRPPLYPLVIAALLKLGAGAIVLGVLQVLLGTVTVWLVWKIGQQYDLGHTATFAAAFLAVDPLLVRYTSFVMTETLCSFLAALLLLAFVSNRERSPFLSSFSLTIVFGFAVMCRPTFWVFGGLMVLVWLWTSWKARRSNSQNKLEYHSRNRAQFFAVSLGLLLTVFPWFLRNCLVMDAPILMTTHGGYTILLGNNLVFYKEVVEKPIGTVWSNHSRMTWSEQNELELRQSGISADDEVARDRWMTRKAIDHIREEPNLFFRACLLRFVRFWNVIPLTSDSPFVVKAGLTLFYSVLYLAMLLGLIHVLRHWNADWFSILILIAAFNLVHLVYWSNTRMRAPAMPAVAVLAAVGISVLWKRWYKESHHPANHSSPM